MNPALNALITMEEYEGPEEAFMAESATVVRGALNCSAEESARIIQDLRESRQIDFRITLGGQLPDHETEYARWYWYVPEEV